MKLCQKLFQTIGLGGWVETRTDGQNFDPIVMFLIRLLKTLKVVHVVSKTRSLGQIKINIEVTVLIQSS